MCFRDDVQQLSSTFVVTSHFEEAVFPAVLCLAQGVVYTQLFTLSNSFDNRGVLIWPPAALSLAFRYCQIFLWRALQY